MGVCVSSDSLWLKGCLQEGKQQVWILAKQEHTHLYAKKEILKEIWAYDNIVFSDIPLNYLCTMEDLLA